MERGREREGGKGGGGVERCGIRRGRERVGWRESGEEGKGWICGWLFGNKGMRNMLQMLALALYTTKQHIPPAT